MRSKSSSTIVLVFLLMGVLGAALNFQAVNASPYMDIDVDTTYNMITNGSYPDLVVLDVRTQSEYDSGHIYGAVWIPHTELETRISELVGHENHGIIVYCGSGVRSVTASEILDSYNFVNVYNMLGGIQAWQSSGYPTWTAAVHNVNTTFNYDSIQAAVDAPQTLDGHTILVDAGTYHEHVTIDKSISLIGENRNSTVVDGDGAGDVIKITAYHVSVTGFTIRNGTKGIFNFRDFNIISGNVVADNREGIYLFASCPCAPSSRNTIRNNIIKDNEFGIYLDVADYNVIYHNSLTRNINPVFVTPGYTNIWDNGYPSGGNYWSNFTGVDNYSGLKQDQHGSDGIGDTPYVIDWKNEDKYPLMGVHWDFNAASEHRIQIICNSTISDFQFNGTVTCFNVTGEDGTIGFCRISIPTASMNGTYKIYVNNTEVPYTLLSCSNTTYSYLYFTYSHSTQEVVMTTESYELLNEYLQLLANFDSLNSTYHELLDDYALLQGSYNSLNSTYNDLLAAYDQMQPDYEAATNELSNIRNLMYVFIVTTIVLTATVVYSAIRKPKIKL